MEVLTLGRAAVCIVMGPEERELFPWDEEIYLAPLQPERKDTHQQLVGGLFCTSAPVEKAGMTHCCDVRCQWSPEHHLGQVRGTVTWRGRRKIFTDVFHGDRDTTGYPAEKKLGQ